MYFINNIYIANKYLDIRFETINITKENEYSSSLVFFSDILFDTKDSTYLNETISKINKLHPDIVIFGGNLLTSINTTLDDTSIKYLVSELSKIKADDGKFAVLGDKDISNQNNMGTIINILELANFEILNNKSLVIDTNHIKYNLVGINDSINNDLNNLNDTVNVSNDNYTIVISNTPNTIDHLNMEYDYFLAGNTLGGEIRIPLFGSIYEYNHNYIHGKFYFNNSILDITNGIGNIHSNYRIFANREIVHYTIK